MQSSRIPLDIDAMAISENSETRNFISPFPHPRAIGVDFFATNLNKWSSLSFSSFKNSFKGFTEDERLQGTYDTNCPQVAQAALILSPPRQSDQSPLHPTNSDPEGRTENLPLSYKKLLSLCRLDFMKHLYSTKH